MASFTFLGLQCSEGQNPIIFEVTAGATTLETEEQSSSSLQFSTGTRFREGLFLSRPALGVILDADMVVIEVWCGAKWYLLCNGHSSSAPLALQLSAIQDME